MPEKKGNYQPGHKKKKKSAQKNVSEVTPGKEKKIGHEIT